MLLKRIEHFDSNYLRGIAILTIMLHNYFHILDGAPGENEFSFSTATTYTYLHNLFYETADFFKQTFSFFGHYAVQIFIFLSGYGLAMRYKGANGLSYHTFLKERFHKVYPVLFFAVTFLFLYKTAITILLPTKAMELGTFAYEASLKLALISNVIPGEALSISGPWWFFSLLFQLYLIAPLLLQLRKQQHLLAFIVIPWAIQFLLITYSPDAIPYLRVNLPGHLPEFVLGIYFARVTPPKTISPLVLLSALVLFIAGSFNQYLWIVSFISVPLLALAAYTYASPSPQGPLSGFITFFGRNSLYFFAVHGLCRAPFVPWGNQLDLWPIVAALAYLAVVVIMTMLFKFLVQTVMSWVNQTWQASLTRK